jgi:hypothetical protein
MSTLYFILSIFSLKEGGYSAQVVVGYKGENSVYCLEYN